MSIVELRSDTFTQPVEGMRKAMATARCGDDMVGEDPTVNELEARICQLLGKEAAVFACSGTQSNQMAVWAHCRSGDELLIEETGHIANYEAGAPAVLSGVSCRKIKGVRGMLTADLLRGALRSENQHFAPTTLICIENTANLGGGVCYPLSQLRGIAEWARSKSIPVHMDGARFFNACQATDQSPTDVADFCDSVSICFSKGLGCPMGSILVGSKELISRARRARKMFGGALRQAGIVAAACLYALDHHIERLKDDHSNAQLFARQISEIPGIVIDPREVETNLVFFEIDPAKATAQQVSHALAQRDIRISALGPQKLRACTHMDVSQSDILRAVASLREVMLACPLPSIGPVIGAAY